jgi:hypothetical protein
MNFKPTHQECKSSATFSLYRALSASIAAFQPPDGPCTLGLPHGHIGWPIKIGIFNLRNTIELVP